MSASEPTSSCAEKRVSPEVDPLALEVAALRAANERLVRERDAARANYLSAQRERDQLWLDVQHLRAENAVLLDRLRRSA